MPTWSRFSLKFNVFEFALQQVGAPTVPSCLILESVSLVVKLCRITLFMSNHDIHVKSCVLCQIMSFMSNHVIHVKSCHSSQIMSNYVIHVTIHGIHSIHVKSCHSSQIMSFMSPFMAFIAFMLSFMSSFMCIGL
jgi:hypothetical protein